MILQVSRDTYSFTTSEVQAKQAELQATYRKQRLIQVRCQDKQHAEFKRQQYKENCQQFASFEQVSSGQEWQHQSSAALVELQQQLSANLAKTGQGQKAAHAANQTAAVLAAHRTAERAAQLQLAKQRFAHALQLKHSEQSAAVAGSVNRLQRISNTMAAESTRAHALAQHHRAIQAEAAANGLLPAATNWSESALRSIDYNHTRLHELGTTVPRTVLVERNGDRGKTQCNEAAETAVQLQARCAFLLLFPCSGWLPYKGVVDSFVQARHAFFTLMGWNNLDQAFEKARSSAVTHSLALFTKDHHTAQPPLMLITGNAV